MTDLEKTNTVRKKMKKRSTIGWTLFALLVGLAFFDFITYTIVLMLSFPMMAIIIVLNARVDTIVEHNDQRLFVLGVTLALVSFTAYSGQLQKNVQENNALEHC